MHGEGRRHNRKSLRDSRASEEMPGCVRGCITQRARKDCGRLVSGMQPMAGHVPVQVEAGEVPAMELGKLFGQVEQSLEEELTVPPTCGHAVREVSAPMRKLLLEELMVERRFDRRKLKVERGAPMW